LSVQQLTSDATAISKLENANSSPVLLAVDDTAADIENGLKTLVADTGEIASITASDAPVVVSVATFLADQPALDKIVGGFAISDTAADVAQNLDALTAALSAGTNITSIALTDGGVPMLTISLEQALNDTLALNKIASPHSIVIADSAPASITTTQAIYLSGENIAVDGAPVVATGTVATMKILAQIVTSLLVSQGYTLAVVDTAANIEALGTPQINSLALRDVLLLAASDTSVALSASLAVSLEGAKMVVIAPSGSNVTLTDTSANLNAMLATAIAGLPAIGVSGMVSTTGSVAVSLAQALALEGANLEITGPNGASVGVTLSDLASNLATLTQSQIDALPATGVTAIAVSNTANLALSVAQAQALETDNLAVQAETGFAVTISDTAANLEGLTASQIDGLTAIGVTGLVSTDANVSYTSAQTAAILSSGLNVSAAGSYTVTENFANGDDSVYQGGQLIQQKFVNPDGSYDIAYFDVTGQTYSSYEDIYNSAGALVADAQDNVNGSGSLILYANGLTITSASGSDSVTTGSDTFAINPHSTETIAGFVVGDTIDLTSLPYDPSDSSYSVAPGSGSDNYLVTFDEGTSSYSLQFNQSTPVTLTEFALYAGANGETEVTVPIADNGVTALLQVGNHYKLEVVSTGTGPLLELNGSAVAAGQFPAGWTPVGAIETGDGYEVAWSVPGANEYVVWNTDSDGDYTSAATGILSGASAELEAVEADFGETFPGAGPPATKTRIAANGVTTLAQVGDLFELNPASGETGPLIELNGSVVAAGQFPAGWTPVGAEETASGYEVAWSVPDANEFVVWNTDSNGDYTSAATGILSGTSPELEAVEAAFGETFPGAGPPAPTASGYEVAWSVLGANEYVVWNTDRNGDFTSAATGVAPGQSFALEDLNPLFGENLNGAPGLSAVLVTTDPGGAVNLSAQTQNIAINLGANSASAIGGLNASSLSFNGTPYAIALGSDPDIVEYGLAPSSGIETIANFVLGRDELNIDLQGAADSALQFYNTTVDGLHAISIASGADPAHGLVLLNMPAGDTAAVLQASHTTLMGGHALIS
ncbi:MAG: beta strand repeat-containing protein, partial [Solirubrobacteraceae bacterium]